MASEIPREHGVQDRSVQATTAPADHRYAGIRSMALFAWWLVIAGSGGYVGTRALRTRFQRQEVPPGAEPLVVSNWRQIAGADWAPKKRIVSMVVFTDFQCSACKSFHDRLKT